MLQVLLRSLARTPSAWVAAAALAALPVLLLATPLSSLAPASTDGLMAALVYLGALAGAVLSQKPLHGERWPMSSLAGTARLVLRWQLPSCLLLAAIMALPGPVLLSLLGAGTINSHIAFIYVSITCHMASLSVLVLQLRIPEEVRSLLVVLLAWALPSALPQDGWLGATLQEVLGTARSLGSPLHAGSAAWGAVLAPIVVLLGSALLLQELQNPRR